MLLGPISAWALDDRCTGPCPNNADCICGPNDIALVKVNGKWVKPAVKPLDMSKKTVVEASKVPAVKADVKVAAKAPK